MTRTRGYVTEALVLRATPFSETSQVVHLATEHHGLVTALAKGSRRPGSAFQGGLGLGMVGEAHVGPRRGAELELLHRFRRRDRLRELGGELPRFHAACYVIELLRAWMRPALPNPALYRAGMTALAALARGDGETLSFWVAWFEARAVRAAGHAPRLDLCAACGSDAGRTRAFAPAAGGLVHDACSTPGPRRRLRDGTIRALIRLHGTALRDLVREPLEPRALREIRAVHDMLVAYLLERQPRALAGLPRP